MNVLGIIVVLISVVIFMLGIFSLGRIDNMNNTDEDDLIRKLVVLITSLSGLQTILSMLSLVW